MSRRYLSVTVYACLAVLLLILVAPSYAADTASCSLTNGVMTCGGQFSTSGQSMFGLGQSQYIYNNTFGTSWSGGGSVGGIYNAGIFGTWGGEVHGYTSGNLGLSVDFRASSGTVNATAPGAVSLSMDTSRAYRPGELVTISSSYIAQGLSASNFGFTTSSPNIGASAQVGFRLQASAGATLCVYDCVGFNVPIDTGQQTIPIFSYNEALYGTSANQIVTDNSGLKIFGVSVAQPAYSGDVGSLVGLPSGTWTADVDLSADATVVNTAGTYSGSGSSVSASVTAANPMLSTTLDVAKLLTNVDGVGVSSGTLGDLMPDNTPGLIKDLGDLVGYTLAKVNVGAGLSLGQNFSMSAPTGALITLDIKQGDTEYQKLTFEAGDTVSFRMPDSTCAGSSCMAPGALTITPTITLDPLGFSSTTTLNPSLNLGVQALDVNFMGLDTGYAVDWQKSLPLGSVSLFTKNFDLGGFNTLTANQQFTLNTTLDPSGASIIDYDFWKGIETVYYSYKDVGSGGLQMDYFQGSTLKTETLIGSVMRPVDGLERSTLDSWGGGGATMVTLDKSSTIRSFDIKDDGWIRGDWTIASQTGRNVLDNVRGDWLYHLSLDTQSGGTLVLKNSNLSELQQITGEGALILDNSSLTLSRFGTVKTETLNASLMLQNGSSLTAHGGFVINTSKPLEITSGSTFYSETDITAGSGATSGIFIDVGENSLFKLMPNKTLDASGMGGTLNITGGTAQLGGMTNVNVFVNKGGLLLLPTQDWGFKVTGGSVTLNGGAMEVSFGDFNAPITGTGNVRVTSVPSASTLFDQDVVLGAGSRLDVEGQLTARQKLQADLVDVSGYLTARQSVVFGSLNVEKQAGVYLSGISTIGQLKNSGSMDIRSDTLTTPNAIINGGNFYVRDSTIYAPGFENVGGTFSAQGQVTLTGNYIQHDGRTVIGDATFTAPKLVIEGGTVLAGKSTINGLVINGETVTTASGTSVTGGVFRTYGSATINGDYSQSANGTLEFAFNGANSFDRLLVNGNVTLDGILQLDLSSNFFSNLLLGDTFNLLAANEGALNGEFSQVLFNYSGSAADLPFGVGWDVLYSPTGVSLMWLTGGDYGPWAVAVHNGTTPPSTIGDLPNQGLASDVVDYLAGQGIDTSNVGDAIVMYAYFASTQIEPVNLQVQQPQVPEPTSLVLLGMGLLAGARIVRTKRGAQP